MVTFFLNIITVQHTRYCKTDMYKSIVQYKLHTEGVLQFQSTCCRANDPYLRPSVPQTSRVCPGWGPSLHA